MTTVFRWMYDFSYRFQQAKLGSRCHTLSSYRPGERSKGRGTVLDLGCGSGNHSLYLARQGYTVVGVDFSPKAISLAKEKARLAGVTLEFRLGDVTRLDSFTSRSIIYWMLAVFTG